jgi:hypothetical protein
MRNMFDDLVSLVANHQVDPVDSQLLQQVEVAFQQAAPAKFHQAFGPALGVVFRQPATPPGGQNDCVHR